MTHAELEKDALALLHALLKDVPGKIATALAAAESPTECEAIIRAALLEALAGLEAAAPGRRN
jgi:hypothetical protein